MIIKGHPGWLRKWPTFFLCAEHVRQLGGEKSSTQPDGGEELAKRKGVVARRV